MADIVNYFDYAAATPMLPEAIAVMEPFYSDAFYNPSALYLGARANRQELDTFRHMVASELGARPTEIIFTAGGTEANNLALVGVLQAFPGGHLVTTAIEHDSVLMPAARYPHTVVGVNAKGQVAVLDIVAAITDKTVLVSVMYANNEVGAIQPIKEIAQAIDAIKKRRKQEGNNTPLYFHTDACQASNYLDMQVSKLGVDMMTINGGKVYGPKQSGALYVKAGMQLEPLILGGGQEWGMRSGTENLAAIAGFATAWQKVRHNYHAEAKKTAELRDVVVATLEKALPGCIANGPRGNHRLANNIHVTFNGVDNERLLMELDEQGYQIATGSACSASSDEPSHVLKAMGISDKAAQNSVRITLGRYSTNESVNKLCETIIKIVALS